VPGVSCDSGEVRVVKDALNQNDLNVGVGLLHEPTGRIYLRPIDSLPHKGGHAELVAELGLPQRECKGFVISKSPAGAFVPVNLSHLNGPQGSPGSLQMPQATFDEIVKALGSAGL
jgi:hypothetical protein